MKTIAKQEELCLPPDRVQPSPERVFRRKDSRFWQAQYRDATGALTRRSTGTTLHASALTWLACAQREAARKHDSTPRDLSAPTPECQDFFPPES